MDDLPPGFDLQASRACSDLRLKSTFEAIFKKYEHDFTGIGDEIDFETGEVVVDNGHIMGMRNEMDVGNPCEERSEALQTFTKAFNENQKPKETSAIPVSGLDSPATEGGEEGEVFADTGVQSDDDLDSLLGMPEENTYVPSDPKPHKDDIWTAKRHLKNIMYWDDGTRTRESPSNEANLYQFRSSSGHHITELLSFKRKAEDQPVEEAWRVPALATAPSTKRPILRSLLNLRQERSRSPPNNTSIWASARSKGWPRKGESHIFHRGATTGAGSHTEPLATRQVPALEDDRVDLGRHSWRAAKSSSVACPAKHKRRRCESLLKNLLTPEANRRHACTIDELAICSPENVTPEAANRTTSYATPESSSIPKTTLVQRSASPSLKRKRGGQAEQRYKTISDQGEQFKAQGSQQKMSWKHIAALHPQADVHTLVFLYYNQPLSPPRMKQSRVDCVNWTQREEELLRHLKETTSLTYAQLVEYFPGRSKEDVESYYLKEAPNVKLEPEKARNSPGPPFTPEEDELLLELRASGAMLWKEIPSLFPGRSLYNLRNRYHRVLSLTPSAPDRIASVRGTFTAAIDRLHDYPLESKAKLTPSEHELRQRSTSTEPFICEKGPQATLDRTEVDAKAGCDPKFDRLFSFSLTSTQDKRFEGPTTETQHSFQSTLKSRAVRSKPKQGKAVQLGEGDIPVMATPDSGGEFYPLGKAPAEEQVLCDRSFAVHSPKLPSKKMSQPPTPQSTSTRNKNRRVPTPRAAGPRSRRKTLTPRSKAAFVSFIVDATDEEDELSYPVVTLGAAKAVPFTTPNGTIRHCGAGTERCGRQFCFKCM
ncbi:hypothetical protein MMC16_000321 [Acarospora aff. strigata]|nr:hypothetical protein [Acarospora aff. strigata]